MRIPFTILTILALLTVSACDSGETDPPETKQYTKTIEARHAEADSVVTTAELSAVGSSFASDGVGELTREEGTTQVVNVSAPKFEDESVAVPFENGSRYTIAMTPKDTEPENKAPTAVATVDTDEAETDETVTFTGDQSSDPNGDDLTYSWTFPDGDASGESVQRSFGSTGDKTAELVVSDGELTDEAEVTVTITEPTTAVTVEAVSVENQQTLSSQIELLVADSVYTAGESPLEASVPESVDELTVNAVEHEQDKEVYADTSKTFVIEDSPVTVGQRRVPHCSNGFDNDEDGLVGVWTDEDGNDIPTEGDSGDPGCRSQQDDGEPHEIYKHVGSTSDTLLVSSAEGKHTNLIGDYSSVLPLPASIEDAVGNVFFAQTNLIDSEKDNQGFAFIIKTGTEDNMTDTYQTAIVRDDNSLDGWRTSVLVGVKPEWFADGKRYYQEIGVHQCKADEDLSCDGSDDDEVIFSTEDEGATIFSFLRVRQRLRKRSRRAVGKASPKPKRQCAVDWLRHRPVGRKRTKPSAHGGL